MKERPILFSGPMVRAILAGQKTQTRRVITERSLKPGSCSWKTSDIDLSRAWADPGLGSGGYLKAPFKHKNDSWERDPADDQVTRLYGPFDVGDRLWVRETFTTFRTRTEAEQAEMTAKAERFLKGQVTDVLAEALALPDSTGPLKPLYKADFGTWADEPDCDLGPWTPSIYMPRAHSRLTLEITEIRVQRLQDISDVDVYDEGLIDAFQYDIDGQPWIGEGKATNRSRQAFRELWDSINGKRPGCAWAENPWVWAISFKGCDL